MELRIFAEPQEGAEHEVLLQAARCAENAGFGAFFRSDHYMHTGSAPRWPGPSDAWLTLAALARETLRIRLGVMMSPVTFRSPGQLAVIAAQADRMSGGRVELGLGAGWFADEHAAIGVCFPGLRERFDRLDEQLRVITGLWATPAGETFSYSGQHYTIVKSAALPKPAQYPRPPIIIGGKGPRRGPELAARYADEFNVSLRGIEVSAAQFARVTAACERIGRDPGQIRRSIMQPVCVGRTKAELARRAKAIGADPDDLRARGLAGSPAEVVDQLGQWADQAGVSRVYAQVLDLTDLDHLELLAAAVAEQVAGIR